MKILLPRKFSLVTLSLFFTGQFSWAQPFTPDKTGHVYDQKFNAFIKAQGYELVGAFNIVQQNPLIAYAKVFKNGTWSTIDTYGKVVLNVPEKSSSRELKGDRGDDDDDQFNPFKYVHPSNADLQITQNNGKYGLKNVKINKNIIPEIYDKLTLTNFKFVAIKQNDKWGTITKQGQKMMPPRYDEIKSLGVNMAHTNYITGDAMIMRVGDKWGLLSDEGKEIVSPQYDKIESSWIISSLLITTLDQKKGILNKSGRELSKPIYSRIDFFSFGGTAGVAVGPFNSLSFGLIDTLGRQIIKPVYDNVRIVSKTMIAASEGKYPNTRVVLFNNKGEQLSKTDYKFVGAVRNNAVVIVVNEDGHDKKGIIDSNGRELIKPIYDELQDNYGNGVYNCRINGKYGMLKTNGEYLVEPVYDEMNGLDMTTCIVKKDGKYGLMDKSGQLLVPLKYDGQFNCRAGLISTFLDGKHCIVDLYGHQYFDGDNSKHAAYGN